MAALSEMGDPSLEVLEVDVGGYRCGVPLATVVEVIPAVGVVSLPGVPPWIEGAFDLRGELVALVNGRVRLGMSPAPVGLADRFVVVQVPAGKRALRVDSAHGILAVPPEELLDGALETEPPSVIARLADGLLVILDPCAFLSVEDEMSIAQALRALDGAAAG